MASSWSSLILTLRLILVTSTLLPMRSWAGDFRAAVTVYVSPSCRTVQATDIPPSPSTALFPPLSPLVCGGFRDRRGRWPSAGLEKQMSPEAGVARCREMAPWAAGGTGSLHPPTRPTRPSAQAWKLPSHRHPSVLSEEVSKSRQIPANRA